MLKIAPNIIEELQSLETRIHALDPKSSIYLVGGYLRDLLCHLKPSSDYEFVTNLHPDLAVKLEFSRVGKGFPVYLSSQNTEIALTRVDRKVGKGYSGFSTEFTPSFREDALRRDLTINTVLWHPSVGLIFPVEEAIEDFQTHTLRACTEAFAEDPIRVFRIARFADKLQGWHVDSWTQDLCDRLASEACEQDYNRIFKEFEKVLNSNSDFTHFHHYLPKAVQQKWLKGFNQEGFILYEPLWPAACSTLKWATLAVATSQPITFLTQFNLGNQVIAAAKTLEFIFEIQYGLQKPTPKVLLELWGHFRRGAVPWDDWLQYAWPRLGPQICAQLFRLQQFPTQVFSGPEEREAYYLRVLGA